MAFLKVVYTLAFLVMLWFLAAGLVTPRAPFTLLDIGLIVCCLIVYVFWLFDNAGPDPETEGGENAR